MPDDAGFIIDDTTNAAAMQSRRPEIRLVAATASRAEAARPIPYFSFDEDDWSECDIDPRPWIAPGYLMRGAITALIGAGAAGKSSLLVAWTIALALGTPFHRLKPKQSFRVLTLNTEDGKQEQRRRFSAALRQTGRLPSDLQGQVVRCNSLRFGPLFGKLPVGVVEELPPMEELKAKIASFRPDVLILDPLIDLHAIEENSNVEMREVMSLLRALAVEFGLSIVVAHHTRKGIVTPGDAEAARGASAVKDLARIAMTLTAMQEEDAKAFNIPLDRRHYYFRLDDAKQNYAAMRSAEWFERHAYVLDNGDLVAAALPWSPPIDTITPDIKRSIEDDLACGSSDGPWSPKLDTSARSFKQLCVRYGVVTSNGQTKMLDELLATGGYRIQQFKRPSNSAKAQGIRCPDGRPFTAHWIEFQADEKHP